MPIAVKSIALPTFPEGLFKGLGTIRQSNIGQNNPYGRKYYVLNLALAQFYDYRERSAQTAYTLSDADCKIYNVDSGIPGYFADKFDQTKIREIYVSSKEDYHYDFDSSYESNSMAFWLDFADQKLGGGVFGQGFLQEERMCCETPDLANAAAVGIETRTGGPEVLKGSPTRSRASTACLTRRTFTI